MTTKVTSIQQKDAQYTQNYAMFYRMYVATWSDKKIV